MISCHACKREYADTASFCPFCGAKPGDAAGGQPPKSMIEADQQTVALDISAMNLPPEEPKAPAPAAPQFSPDAPVDRTVAMQVPAELLAEPTPSAQPASRKPPKRSGTILGMPGMAQGGENPLDALKKPAASGGGAALKAGLVPQSQGAGAPPPVTSDVSAGVGGDDKTVAFNPADLGLDGVGTPAPAPQAAAPQAPAPQAAAASYPDPAPTVAVQAVQPPPAAAAPAFAPPVASAAPAAAPAFGPGATPAATAQPAAPAFGPGASPAAGQGFGASPAAGQGFGAPAGTPAAAAPKKKSGGGGSKALFIVVGLLLVAGIVAALMLLTGGSSMDSAVSDTATKNIPGDVDGFGGVNLDRLRDSWVYEKFGAQIEAGLKENRGARMVLEKTGLKVEDLHVVSLGWYHRIPGEGEGERIDEGAVIAIKADIDVDKINGVLAEELGGGKDDRKHDIGGTTFYGRKDNILAAAADGVLLAAGPGIDRAEALMKTRGGEAAFDQNAELMSALGLVDKGAVMFGAINVDKNIRREFPRQLREFIKIGDWVAGSVDFSSGEVKVSIGAVLDADRAKKAASSIEMGLAGAEVALGSGMVPEQFVDAAKEVLDSISFSQSDATLKISFTIPESLAGLAAAGGL